MLRRCRPLLGTFVEVNADWGLAIEAAFGAIERVHRLMSAHQPDSDVSRINRFAHLEPVEVDEATARVIQRALFWAKRSGGVFDIVRAGKAAVERALLPRHDDQPQPVAADWTYLKVHGCAMRLLKPGCIDLGGIAKGFAVDRAVEALREAGCERGLINAGGDLRAFGPEPWPVEVVDPVSRQPIAAVELQEAAFATSAGIPSGNGELSFNHLADAEPYWISASVLAPTACDADALTKIVWNNRDTAAPLLDQAHAKSFGVTRDGRIESITEAERVPA